MDGEAGLFEPMQPIGIEIARRHGRVTAALLLDPQDLQGLAKVVKAVSGSHWDFHNLTEDEAEEALINGAPLEPIFLRMDMEQVRRLSCLRVVRLLAPIGCWIRLKPFEGHARLDLSDESLERLKQ